MTIRKKHIRTMVDRILFEQSISSPQIPVERIVKSLGIKLKKDDVEDNLSGFLIRDLNNGTAVIGVNRNHSKPRQRFTIAHEIGHYLLHEGEVAHFDGNRPGFTVNLRYREDPKSSNDIEREANLFAAELLMPARFLERDSRIKNSDLDLLNEDDDVLQEIAKEYGVSLQALTYRLANLGLIDPV